MTEPRARSLFSLSALRQDLRFAGRMLVKSPLFTGMVVLTLALGIGLNTAVFSAIEAMLLRPLPGVRESGQLVQLYRTYPAMDYGSNSIPHFWDVRKRTTDVYSGVAAWSFSMMSVTAEGRPVKVMGQMTSADYFSVLGVRAAKGRTFVPAEDEGRGAHPVAVPSDAGWKNLFGESADVIGRTLLVNGQNVEIIGVTPPEFRGAMPVAMPAMWMPLMQLGQLRPGSESDFENRGNNYMNVIARLKPGVTTAQARARLAALISELRGELPEAYEKSAINLVPQSEAGIHPTMRGAQVALSAVVMIVVGLLLLIACVNVANLFLARARDRAREMAIRLALGARRGALVRQLLVESLAFSFVSGVAGLLVAAWTIGRTVRTARREYTVVGVVPTGKYVRLGEDPTAHMWFPQAQNWNSGMTAVIRTVGDPNAFIGTLRSEVTALDANLPLSNIRSMDKHLGISLLPARLTGAALGAFGVLGLLLASVGMYGVMAYSVSQRTREIGIRMAIGAQAADVIQLVMRQGLTLVLIGTLIGLAGALAASRLLGAVLYGGNSLDLMTFTVVPVVLIAVAALASFVPARRAAQVDPMHALRYD